MKAVLLSKTGDTSDLKSNLTIADIPDPECGDDDVLIRIKYAALNHRDLWITKGLYAKMALPVVLGSDCSGIVEETGSNVTGFNKGDEVIVNPGMDWGNNEDYQSPAFKILGMPDQGTLAEYLSIDQRYVYKKPSHLSLLEAAALPLVGVTAYRSCIVKANIKVGENVLVTGIGGGVSTMAMMISLSKGANVYVTSSSEEKIQKAVELGAVTGANYTKPEWAKEILAKAGKIDVVIDSAGGETISKCVDIAAYGARLVSYGATLGIAKDLDVRKLYWKQLKMLGSTMGSDKDFKAMVEYLESHKIKPIIDKTFPIEKIHDAFLRMNNSAQTGKIVIEI